MTLFFRRRLAVNPSPGHRLLFFCTLRAAKTSCLHLIRCPAAASALRPVMAFEGVPADPDQPVGDRSVPCAGSRPMRENHQIKEIIKCRGGTSTPSWCLVMIFGCLPQSATHLGGTSSKSRFRLPAPSCSRIASGPATPMAQERAACKRAPWLRPAGCISPWRRPRPRIAGIRVLPSILFRALHLLRPQCEEACPTTPDPATPDSEMGETCSVSMSSTLG